MSNQENIQSTNQRLGLVEDSPIQCLWGQAGHFKEQSIPEATENFLTFKVNAVPL